MQAELESLVTRWYGDASGYMNAMNQVGSSSQRAIQEVEAASRRVEGLTQRLSGFGQTAMGILGSMGASMSFGGLVTSAVQQAAEMEQTQLSFEVLLQSAERGQQMTRDLIQFAAVTPMTLPGITQATRTLLQFGVSGENVIPIMRMLGDVAAGDAQRFASLALAFGQMTSAGRLMGQDRNQMVAAGFNPVRQLELMGEIPAGQGNQLMEAGGISAEMVMRAFQNVTQEGGNFFNMMDRQSRTTAGLFSTMQDNVMAMMRTIGENIIRDLRLNDVIRGFSYVAGLTSEWLTTMDPNTRRVATAIAMATAGVIALGLAFTVAGIAFNAAFGGIGYTLGILAIATAGVAAWAWSFESVRTAAGNAWDWIKEKTAAFMEWSAPIFWQYVSVAKAAWDLTVEIAIGAWNLIAEGATWLWGFFSEMWTSIFGESSITMNDIRDAWVEGLIMIEFVLRNFGQVAQYVWLGIQLGAVAAFGEITHFFTDVVPAVLAYFQQNWRAIFTEAFMFFVDINQRLGDIIVNTFQSIDWGGLWDGFKEGVRSVAENAVNVFVAIPEMVAGLISFEDVWADQAGTAVANITEELSTLPDAIEQGLPPLVIPPRQMSELETQLRAEFAQMGAALGTSYEAFRQQRIAELYDVAPEQAEEAVQAANRTGLNMGENLTRGVAKGTEKLDAALFGSAEAMARMATYAATLQEARSPRSGLTTGGAPMNALSLAPSPASARANEQASIHEDKEITQGLLSEIRDLLAEIRDTGEDVEAVDLGE